MRVVRTVVVVLATIGVLAAPAYSQGRGKGGKHSTADQQKVEQKKKASETEKAYKATLDRMPDQKFDPWANMR